MKIDCPSCRAGMELGEMEWNQGVASLGCESCGAEFRVLPGGEAELLRR